MHILLATDGSSSSDTAIDIVKRLPLPSDSKLHVLTVLDQGELLTYDEDGLVEEVQNLLSQQHRTRQQEAEQMLQQVAARFAETGWLIHTTVREGHVVREILEAARVWGADLIVIGSRGLGSMQRLLLGGVSHKVMTHAPCSVLVSRQRADRKAEMAEPPVVQDTDTPLHCRLLLAYDGSATAQAMIQTLTALPLHDHVELTLVTVMPLITYYRMDILQHLSAIWQEKKEATQSELDAIAQDLRQLTPHVTVHVREGADPSQEILDAAQASNADLIVLGHKGRGRIEEFLVGSVANRVVQYAPCSVWVMRV